MLASPGMLQSGPSRELLELWAPDPRNGLIMTGYSVEGTMARVSLCSILYDSFLHAINVFLSTSKYNVDLINRVGPC